MSFANYRRHTTWALPALPDLWAEAKRLLARALAHTGAAQEIARKAHLSRSSRREIVLWIEPVEKMVRGVIAARAVIHLLMTPEGRKLLREARRDYSARARARSRTAAAEARIAQPAHHPASRLAHHLAAAAQARTDPAVAAVAARGHRARPRPRRSVLVELSLSRRLPHTGAGRAGRPARAPPRPAHLAARRLGRTAPAKAGRRRRFRQRRFHHRRFRQRLEAGLALCPPHRDAAPRHRQSRPRHPPPRRRAGEDRARRSRPAALAQRSRPPALAQLAPGRPLRRPGPRTRAACTCAPCIGPSTGSTARPMTPDRPPNRKPPRLAGPPARSRAFGRETYSPHQHVILGKARSAASRGSQFEGQRK